jgi:hypothetical protein
MAPIATVAVSASGTVLEGLQRQTPNTKRRAMAEIVTAFTVRPGAGPQQGSSKDLTANVCDATKLFQKDSDATERF